MKINIHDIPPEGREVIFELDDFRLNGRVHSFRDTARENSVSPPEYIFKGPNPVRIRLSLEGVTVFIEGSAAGRYISQCSRCAEEAEMSLVVPLKMILKPKSDRGPEGALDEDMHFGFYSGTEIDCSEIVEEFMILALPYTVFCEPGCRGLCGVCGVNLNMEPCKCTKETGTKDERFKALERLKNLN